jgi:hypothetical protein
MGLWGEMMHDGVVVFCCDLLPVVAGNHETSLRAIAWQSHEMSACFKELISYRLWVELSCVVSCCDYVTPSFFCLDAKERSKEKNQGCSGIG